jgi:hypothetical protein
MSKSVQVDGYFIRKSSKEKIVAKLFVPLNDNGIVQFHLLQWSFKALDSFSAIDVRYYPADIIEYGFKYEKTDYCFYAIENIFSLDNGRSKFQDRKFVFIKVEIKGPCKLFSCYKLNSVSSDISSILGLYNKIPCLKINNKQWFIFESYNFKNDISEYFKDYAELATKIKTGVYTIKDLELIVKEYNQWFLKK